MKRVGELYANPIGHDALHKVLLQLNVSEKLIQNPLIANLKLSTIARLTKKQLGQGFFNTLLNLINLEKDILKCMQRKKGKKKHIKN